MLSSVGLVPHSRDLAIAPTDIGSEHNGFRAPLLPVASWELADHHFAFDSSILLPSMTADLAELVLLLGVNPGCPIAIFGHADPTGGEGYNKLLSGRRATALFALLTRRADLWLQLASQPMGNDDWKKNDRALRLFNPVLGLPADAPGDLAALIPRYMDALSVGPTGRPFVLTPNAFLGRGADPKGKVDFQGCGEFNPLRVFSAAEAARLAAPALKTERDDENAVNRRVTVFLFAKGSAAVPSRWPCPRATEGVTACRKRFWSDAGRRAAPGPVRRDHPRPADTFQCRFYDRLDDALRRRHAVRELNLRLLDEVGEPVTEGIVVLTVDGVSLPTRPDAAGKVTFRIPAGATAATLVHDDDRIDIAIAPLPPVTTTAGVQQRLINLGFLTGAADGVAGPVTRQAVTAFQETMNDAGQPIAVNGDPADAEMQARLVAEHGS